MTATSDDLPLQSDVPALGRGVVVGRFYTSGRWSVKPGHEEAFATAFAESGVKDVDPPIRGLLQRPRLLRDLKQPGSYLSYAVWESREAIDEFRSRPDFPAMIARMQEHLDDMQISTLELVLGEELTDMGLDS
ncbi:quinol monooxygenase YgiN [Pseudarthrobacter siccitolerans]|uniref:Quinol monooxygenase YgiN n=1 Tax=Pseudarthrobacter siccitolerans TaxID=861266 RepID=A0ABU0PI60_9MICC|nr:antibiotic biosynthesis monooxygenase family protein [Pseudarthrobacter siccitolerans]MDQ0673645.1 quinol monooxygenase YgiN [Pseudarthrobacter siccitolerans]